MAHVKAQGTQVFAVVDGAVVRFTCPKAFSFGEDSFSKIDSTCLDSDTKDYERLMLDGDAQENWQSALDELGLSLVEAE